MSGFPGSPRLVKGGLVLVDPASGAVQRVIALQYNPDTLSRTFQVQGAGSETGDRTEALRLKGPPVETFKLDAEIDATDQLEHSDQNPAAVQAGIYPQLAALESIIYPAVSRLQAEIGLAQTGVLEIAPVEAPLTLFVWSRNRVVPVRVTELSVTEEAFDPALNPIRAKVSLSLRVLSVLDLPSAHRGAGLYLGYQQQKEALAGTAAPVALGALGIQGLG
jgi:hypothetical protein